MTKNYSDFNGDHFVFVGENATTGKPNVVTGNMSYWGEMLKFHSKESANEYVIHYRGYGICKAGTARTLRKYSLGMSVLNYLEDLHFSDYI
ncbi:hypothetical protein KAR91_57065 [Candidatus Pacearchaeota archaeon]|nr:hypothetical protein [Candidatus Pacearchaeota archaeon]